MVNHILDWRGSQFYDFSEYTFKRQFLWQKFMESIKYSQSYEMDVSVWANRMSRSCSLILSCIGLPVSQDRIEEHDQDIRFARTETSAVSEHAHNTGHKPLWNKVKFIDCDPHYYTRRVKEAIHIRLHPDNINRDSGIEIPEAWMPTIKKHNNRRAMRQRTTKGANH